MRKFTLVASAAVLATAATALYAAPAPHGMMGGTITWAEAKAKADEMWTKLDVNKDGKLDQADRDAKMAQMFDEIDTNHDGSISRDEFMAHHRGMMGEPGKGDGPPSMGDMKHEGMDHSQMDHGRMGHEGMGHGMMGHGMMMGQMLRDADANKDGAISRAEYDAAVKAHFDKVDANHDGKITPEERRAAFAKMRPAMEHEGHEGHDGLPPPPGA